MYTIQKSAIIYKEIYIFSEGFKNGKSDYGTTADHRAAEERQKGLAIAGFVIGCCGVFTWALTFFGIIISVVGIILSALGIKSSRKTFAIIGLIVSALALVATIIYTVVITAAVVGGLSSAGLLG